MKGVFDILSLIMALVVPLSILVYTMLPVDSPSTHRDVWISLGIVVSLVTIGAVIARFAVTETAAEISSSIGFLASVVLIVISEIVLATLLQHELWARLEETAICICLLIADICAWTGFAKRPKFLISLIGGCPGCFHFHNILLGTIGFCDWLVSFGCFGHQQEGLLSR